jgi:Sulfotransferase domain
VIAGAAKCGTTALFEYLSQHSAVYMPTLKEPGFFSSDLAGGVSTLEEYQKLFESASPQCLTGEASTRYIYSRVAIARLLAHNPNVKVITMLRNPVDAAHSLHGYAYRYGHDDIADFERAWREQPVRFARQRPTLPAAAGGHIFEYDYRATYRYAEQVRRVLQYVPGRQRYFVTYEEFFADPSAHYAKILEFLELAPVDSASFGVVNAYAGVRSPRLERLLRRPPRALRALYSPFRPLFEATGLRPVQLIRRMNWGRLRKQPLRAAFREELELYFADDIAELENLLGRRLWNTGKSTLIPEAPQKPAAGAHGTSSSSP